MIIWKTCKNDNKKNLEGIITTTWQEWYKGRLRNKKDSRERDEEDMAAKKSAKKIIWRNCDKKEMLGMMTKKTL